MASGRIAGLIAPRVMTPEACCGEHRHRSYQRNIEETARVVTMKIDSYPSNNRTYAVEQCRFDKTSVDILPCSPTALPNQPGCYYQNHLFTSVEQIKAVAVGRFVRRNVLPRNYNKQVKIEPPA